MQFELEFAEYEKAVQLDLETLSGHLGTLDSLANIRERVVTQGVSRVDMEALISIYPEAAENCTPAMFTLSPSGTGSDIACESLMSSIVDAISWIMRGIVKVIKKIAEFIVAFIKAMASQYDKPTYKSTPETSKRAQKAADKHDKRAKTRAEAQAASPGDESKDYGYAETGSNIDPFPMQAMQDDLYVAILNHTVKETQGLNFGRIVDILLGAFIVDPEVPVMILEKVTFTAYQMGEMLNKIVMDAFGDLAKDPSRASVEDLLGSISECLNGDSKSEVRKEDWIAGLDINHFINLVNEFDQYISAANGTVYAEYLNKSHATGKLPTGGRSDFPTWLIEKNPNWISPNSDLYGINDVEIDKHQVH